MKTHAIVPYTSENHLSYLKELKESILNSKLQYSTIDLQLILDISDNEIDKAINNAITVCHLVGIKTVFISSKFMYLMLITIP